MMHNNYYYFNSVKNNKNYFSILIQSPASCNHRLVSGNSPNATGVPLQIAKAKHRFFRPKALAILQTKARDIFLPASGRRSKAAALLPVREANKLTGCAASNYSLPEL